MQYTLLLRCIKYIFFKKRKLLAHHVHHHGYYSIIKKKNKYSYYNATCTGYTNSNIQYMRDRFTSRLCSFGKVFIYKQSYIYVHKTDLGLSCV